MKTKYFIEAFTDILVISTFLLIFGLVPKSTLHSFYLDMPGIKLSLFQELAKVWGFFMLGVIPLALFNIIRQRIK